MTLVLLLLAAFFLGSIPTGLLITRARGIDIKKAGSGNIGATNVLRTTGKLPAFLTLIGDMAKGAAAVGIAKHYGLDIFWVGMTGFLAVAGHIFSVFLNFRGGKGVATALGVLLIYSPQTCLFTIIIWLMTVAIFRYSSLGALVSFALLPISIALLDSPEKLPFAVCVLALILLRHRENLQRLLTGTEARLGQRP
ncbi:MAG: acyl-phosphate glycerol 3-phosphate acyltransferase [Thermodesulfovibrio sp.]|nr:acyl-phosphate glycerol 3-phosphate acyltransferase [Thermodesulfovibrio sp.]